VEGCRANYPRFLLAYVVHEYFHSCNAKEASSKR
jgi:predicted metalloprotease with PDZ domain